MQFDARAMPVFPAKEKGRPQPSFLTLRRQREAGARNHSE
jgi:hypothetical protein